MSSAKPKFVPEPRVRSSYQVACRFNVSEATFKKKRPDLERAGFPRYDDLLGGWDSAAIEAWFNLRCGLDLMKQDDSAWMETLND